MSAAPTSEPDSAFVRGCEAQMRTACAGEPFYKTHEGKHYCVLHFPAKEKSADFEKALQKKLENGDFDFRGVWFPDEVSFTRFDFGAAASFNGATFSAAANFNGATFSVGVYFSSATFRGRASFLSATFSADADFSSATFNADTDFSSATFNAKADFRSGTFTAAA